ncbi:MAG: DoxX family protein [Pseudonocardiaceae bacterium]
MNTLLWTLQVLLAVIFAASGTAKISWPKDRLVATGQTGVAPFPLPVVRVTALCELLGAVGILVPRLVGVAEYLTPAAGGGFAVVMVGAMGSHAYLREPRSVALNSIILIAAITVAAGRAFGV